jgi:hypothetical protein
MTKAAQAAFVFGAIRVEDVGAMGFPAKPIAGMARS